MRIGIIGALAAATSIGAIQIAAAADLPAKAPAAKAPGAIVQGWDGFYVGAALGYAWQKDKLDETDRGTSTPSGFTPISTSPNGVKIGGFAGYNWQFGASVFGLEGDIEWADLGWDRALYVNTPTGDSYEARTDWQASIRARLGYSVGTALLYVTGGGAFANIEYNYIDINPAASEKHSSTRAGWTVGGGIDWRFAPRWFARAEYRYADFGKETFSPTVFNNEFDEHHSTTEHAVRFGVGYQFSSMR